METRREEVSGCWGQDRNSEIQRTAGKRIGRQYNLVACSPVLRQVYLSEGSFSGYAPHNGRMRWMAIEDRSDCWCRRGPWTRVWFFGCTIIVVVQFELSFLSDGTGTKLSLAAYAQRFEITPDLVLQQRAQHKHSLV